MDAAFLSSLRDWCAQHGELLAWSAGVSVVVCIAALAMMPWLVARIPTDYFTSPRHRMARWRGRHPAVRLLLVLGQNLLGLFVMCVGLAMLPLPGPGVPLILAGLLMTDFPGKYRLARWLITRPPVAKSVNWLRAKAGRPPLEVPQKQD